MTQSTEIISRMTSATNWALWACDEASGNLADSSGNGFALTARGTPAYQEPAPQNTGILFDGTNDEGATALIAPIGSTLPDTWSVGFNIKGSAQVSKVALGLRNNSFGGLTIITGANAGTDDDRLRVWVQLSNNSNAILTLSGPAILDGNWHHYVAVGSGGNTVTVYVDGEAQTPLSGAWTSNRPTLSNAALACYVSNESFPQNPASEMAVTLENAFVGDIALSEADVVAIYNAGFPDVTAPVLTSATIAADGATVTLAFTEIGSPPILPATSITGFSLSRLGSGLTISSAARATDTTILLTMADPIPPGPVLLSYSAGNVTDTATNALANITDFACTNNSVISTYAEITMLASTASRMVPHTVFVTACAASVPKDGEWRYCSATWDFGDGSTVSVVSPVDSTVKNATTGQTAWSCAAHTYETAGEYTITLTLKDKDGNTASDTATVTVVSDTRTVAYLDSAASPGGDGTLSTPWSTHAEMVADLTSDTKVIMSGTFSLTGTTALPAVSNVWFQADAGGVTFNWTSNPVSDSCVFEVPVGAENIFIDGRTVDYTSRGIVVSSDVVKSTTKNDNQTAFLRSLGSGVACRNVTVSGTIDSGGVCGLAFYGGNGSQTTRGMMALNCDFGDCNNYLSVFTQMEYVCWLGVDAGSAWIEHTQRWLDPTHSKYLSLTWTTLDHKRVNNGTIAATGAQAKDCVRFQAVQYACVMDSVLQAGVIDFGYHVGTASAGEYGPSYYIQMVRCKLNDGAILLRPALLDALVSSCYFYDVYVTADIVTPAAGDKVLSGVSFLHNTMVDPAGSISFFNFHTPTNSTHAFTKSDIEIGGNLFCVAGTSGAFFTIDDADLYTIFSAIQDNVFTDSLSVYVTARNVTSQSVTASHNWATFAASWPDNDQETISASTIDAADSYRPDSGTYPITATFPDGRLDGVLQQDLYGNSRVQWYAGAVDVLPVVLSRQSFGVGLNLGV